ncbi:hypothetical protein GLOTRDRAFT_50439, partial [Gloeophyllum trabeum ATCC 11539]
EEVILRIQGILSAKDLPPQIEPIYIRPNQNRRKAYLRQSIRLTGFSSQTFQRNVDAVQYLSRHVSRFFKEGIVSEWQPSNTDGHPTLEISNRYFSARKHNQADIDVPFSDLVDPEGILRKLSDDRWVHTDDNDVTYYRVVEEEGKLTYLNADPAIFRPGDIVEAETSVLVLPQNGQSGRFRVALVLRSLTLMDARFSDVSACRLTRSVKLTFAIGCICQFGWLNNPGARETASVT